MVIIPSHWLYKPTTIIADTFSNGCQIQKFGDRLLNGKYENFERVCDKFHVTAAVRRAFYNAIRDHDTNEVVAYPDNTRHMTQIALAARDADVLRRILRESYACEAVKNAVRNPNTRIDDVIDFLINGSAEMVRLVAHAAPLSAEQITHVYRAIADKEDGDERREGLWRNPHCPYELYADRDVLDAITHPTVPRELLVREWWRTGNRDLILSNPSCPAELMRELLPELRADTLVVELQMSMASNPNTPSDVLGELALFGCENIFEVLAENPSLEPEHMRSFMADLMRCSDGYIDDVVGQLSQNKACTADVLYDLAEALRDRSYLHEPLAYAYHADVEFLEWLHGFTTDADTSYLARSMAEYKR